MNCRQVARRVTNLFCILAWICFVSTANAGLDTDAHVGTLGTGSTVDHGDGSYTVFDEAGVGDIWTDGDDFQYFYDSTPWSGDFSATVRVLSMTENIAGRWGKSGIMARAEPLATDSAFVLMKTHTGNERLAEPHEQGNGDGVRITWRTTNGLLGPDTINRNDFLNAPVPIPPEPGGAPMWLRMDRTGDEYTVWWANDVGGSPGPWQDQFSTGALPSLAGDVTLGLAYSAGASSPPGQHGVTFDNFHVVPEPSTMVLALLGLVGLFVICLRRHR